MLKRFSLLVLAAMSFVVLRAQEATPTVDDILANYFENTGGAKAWKDLKSTKMEGVMSMQGMEFPGTIYSAPPNKQRVEVNIQGKELIQAYDGTTAWWINPFMGGTEAQPMPKDMSEDMTKQNFESEFMDYAKKGHQVEYVGKETVEGAETYVLKLTKKNGDVEHHYFETENFVPIMVKTTVSSGPSKGQAVETYLSDYQEVDGLMLPFFIESKVNGQSMQKITIKSITLNEEMDAKMFDYPKAQAPDKDKQ